MSISRHIVVGGQMLLGVFALARAPVQRAEAEVAVGEERAHPEFDSQRQDSR